MPWPPWALAAPGPGCPAPQHRTEILVSGLGCKSAVRRSGRGGLARRLGTPPGQGSKVNTLDSGLSGALDRAKLGAGLACSRAGAGLRQEARRWG